MELFSIDAETASLLEDLSNDELCSFAELHDNPAIDGQIELYIYTCFLLFKKSVSTEHLEQAVQRAEGWVAVTPTDHPDRIRRSRIFDMMSVWTSQHRSILEAITFTLPGVDRTVNQEPGSDERSIQIPYLNNEAIRLAKNYQQNGHLEDLKEAIRNLQQALKLGGAYFEPGILSNLGAMLGQLFEHTGSIDDLNRAVDFTTMAVDATPQNDPDRAGYLINLGSWLGTRFDRTGSIDDLNRAVDIATMAVDTTPQDHPGRASYLNNLGNLLSKRFYRTGSMDDLNHAVNIATMAVDAIPQHHPDRAGYLNNLGSRLGTQFGRTGSINDLHHAVKITTMAVDATPQHHPDRAGYLNNLGSWLAMRFGRTGSIDDLNRAVDIATMAVDATPQGRRNQAIILGNLSNWLSNRFRRTGSIDDLNRAIDFITMAVDVTPQDHPDRASHLKNLGDRLSTRFKRTDSIDDLNRTLSSYKEGWSCHTAPPSIRIRLAQAAASILALQQEWDESSQLLEEAVKLLPTVSPRSLNHTDKQHMLAESAGLASMAAATALNAGKATSHALQLLELGRGVIASLLMDVRGDISDLKRKHPGLADEFTSLRDELDSPSDRSTFTISNDSTSSWESQAKRRREADQKFGELIARIRTQPGFERFLLPPTEDEIMAVADLDPIVVVNLSSYRCDAFLVQHNRIAVLELPGLTEEEVRKRAQDLRSSRATGSFHIIPLLEWLWDSIARPTLSALGFEGSISDDKWPRVWWIPTGLLSQLPLHAAGLHVRGSTESVLDRVMSSYAPSIKALVHGRRHPIRESAGPFTDYALLVAMRETPGLAANRILSFAEDEVEMLKSLCRPLKLWSLTPIMRKDSVLQHLQKCKIFHFAGHGQSDPAEPSRSCLLLEDWKTNPLTVGDLLDYRVQENKPFLGYLSACSTGSNEAVKLADEGIHLVSAFQLAGFRHVVGTLWEVSDKHCVDVARVLYETLRDEGMTDVAVCRGLHRAVRALRYSGIRGEKEKEERARDATLEFSESRVQTMADPYWVPYIHFGV
ncbi:CHAT domain-containing protein [Immersiella caudata]|uniref:CHAT domain-containing protein n=1 Tax=Immersiella caudata TaxID=314043 RepID=A0AA39TNM1_9PEZI|nr:CHAT domain-containing protein [Immersiella caudata]